MNSSALHIGMANLPRVVFGDFEYKIVTFSQLQTLSIGLYNIPLTVEDSNCTMLVRLLEKTYGTEHWHYKKALPRIIKEGNILPYEWYAPVLYEYARRGVLEINDRICIRRKV